MQIWVDADACPKVIKDMLFRAAMRLKILTTLVANKTLRIPSCPFIQMVHVSEGFDQADDWIATRVGVGDLVITADIPLAASVIAKGAYALSPRGELYTQNNVRERLSLRDFMEQLRSSGVDTGGPPVISLADRRAFANQLVAITGKMN